ncbi:MAG: hypothetical protein ACT4P4_00665 [Betaproteobacteria bacterium]
MKRAFLLVCVFALQACAPVMYHHGASPELRAAIDAAHKNRVDGPRDVRLTDGTILSLFHGLSYIPTAEGEAIMRALGERPGPGLLGVVVTDSPDPVLIAVLYARGRNARGVPQVEVVGWDPIPGVGFRLRD